MARRRNEDILVMMFFVLSTFTKSSDRMDASSRMTRP
jgi:hypothetical protein